MKSSVLHVTIAAAMAAALSAFGAGVTGDDAKGAVTGWVRLREALDDEIEAEPESVATYQGQDGRGEFHVVSLKGGGYVITSGDTEITPILGYSKTGTFDADENSPMWALLTADVAARAAAVGAIEVPEYLSGTMIIDLGDIDRATAKERIPLFKVGTADMLPAPEALHFVGGIPKGWKLKTSKEGYGYALVRRQFMIIVK